MFWYLQKLCTKKLDTLERLLTHILLPGNIAGLSQMLEPLLWLMGSVFWVWETWVLTEWAFQLVNSRSTQLWRASSPTSVCPSLLTWEPTHKYVNGELLLVLVKYFSLQNKNWILANPVSYCLTPSPPTPLYLWTWTNNILDLVLFLCQHLIAMYIN